MPILCPPPAPRVYDNLFIVSQKEVFWEIFTNLLLSKLWIVQHVEPIVDLRLVLQAGYPASYHRGSQLGRF